MCLYLCMSSPCNSVLIFEMITKKVLICCQLLSSSPSLFTTSLGPQWEACVKLVCSESVLSSLWIWVAAVEIFHLSFSPSEWLVKGSDISSLSIFSLPVTIHLSVFALPFFLDHYKQVQQRLLFYRTAFPFNVFVEAYWRWSSSQRSVFVSFFESVWYPRIIRKSWQIALEGQVK